MGLKEDQSFRKAMDSLKIPIEDAYRMSQDISKARKQAEGLPLIGTGYIPNVVGGVGSSFLRGIGDTAGFLNFNNVENKLNSAADWIDERLPPPKPAELSWDYITSPEGLARNVGNVGGSIASIALPSGIGALKLPNLINKGAQGLSALTKGRIGLDFAKGLIYGGLTVPMEAMMEGRNAEKAVLENGMTPEEARKKAWDVFNRNVGILGVSNMIQGGLVPKVFAKGNTLRGRLGAGAAEVGMQAGEEFEQEGAKNEVLGKPFTYNPLNIGNPKYEEQNQAALEGLMGIAPIVALTGGAGAVRQKYFKNDEEQEKEFDKLFNAGVSKWQGETMPNGKYGCVEAVVRLGSGYSDFLKRNLKETNVDNLLEAARKEGVSVIPFDENKLEKGDVITWLSDTDYSSGGGHVVIYDGKGGFFGNSSSQNKIIHGEDYKTGAWKDKPKFIIKTGEGNFNRDSNIDEVEENDADFTDKQNQMWRLAQYAADRAKNKYGYEVPAELIYKQWVHESGANFDANKTLAEVHNYGGLTQTEENDLPQPDGSNYYRKFNDDTEYADAYIDDFIKHYPEINGVKTEKEFAAVLKKYGYFEDTLENYTRGMEGIAVPKTKMKNPSAIVADKNTSETDSEVATPAEDSYFVDDVLKNLLSQNTPPNFKIERQTPLTRAIYKDFVSSKLQDTSDAESEVNKKFFESHPEFFNKDGEFIHNDKNRAALAQEFGADEISDFGQKLISDRINAIRNIQSPKDSLNFKTSEFEDKNGNKTFVSEIAGTLPKGVRKEIENLATEYGGAVKKGGKFNFANAETRDNFVVDAESYIQSLQATNIVNPVQTQSEIQPAENIQPAQPPTQSEIALPENPIENIQPSQPPTQSEIALSENPAENIQPAQPPTHSEIALPENPAENIQPAPTQSEIQPAENVQPAQTQSEIKPAENIQPAQPPTQSEIALSENPAENIQPVPAQSEIKPAENKINFGNTALNSYKAKNEFNQSQLQKLEKNMSTPIKYDGENLTRQALVEKIASGEIEESAVKINNGDRQYLDFLRENVVKPLQAIQNAGISDKSSNKNYSLGLSYMGGADNTIYESFVSPNEQESFSKDKAALENLTKLAEVFGGKLDKGQMNFGKEAFVFGNDGKAAQNFTTAANLFTSNNHLKYLQNQSEEKPASNNVADFRKNFTPKDFTSWLSFISEPENFEPKENLTAMKSMADIGLQRRALKTLQKAELADKKKPPATDAQDIFPIVRDSSDYFSEDGKQQFPVAVSLNRRLPEGSGNKPVGAFTSALKRLAKKFNSEIDNRNEFEPVYHFKDSNDAVTFAKAAEMYFNNGRRFADLTNAPFSPNLSAKEKSKLLQMQEKVLGKQEKIKAGAEVRAGDKTYAWDGKHLYFRDKATRQGVPEYSGRDFALQYVYGYGDSEKAIKAIDNDLKTPALTYVHENLAEAKKILQDEGQNWKADWAKTKTKTETAPAENKQPAEIETAPAENKQPAPEKRKGRTGIFGTSEDAFREGKEAFKNFGKKEKPAENKPETEKSAYYGTQPPDATVTEDKFVNVVDDSVEAEQFLWDELEKEFNKMSAMAMFNPKIWTLGTKLGLIYVQRGINKFADWAKAMTTAANKKSKTFAEELKIWQPAIFEMLKTMPKIDSFNDEQITSIAKIVGSLYDEGTTNFEDIRSEFIKNFGGETVNEIEPMIKATYNGVKKFFETLDAETKTETAETKKASNKDFELAEGYKTESGRDLQEADSQEFIIKPDGSKDFGRISEDIAEKANARIKELGLEGEVKAAPIRLQVGIPDTEGKDGFGYIHIMPHIAEIKSKGFENIPAYIEHILNNFNQIYKSNAIDRIVLYCKGDKSKGLMPMDLELEKGDDSYYKIITAYPRRRANKNDTLILDTRPTNVSADAATALNDPKINNNSGVNSRSGYSEENVSAENITQAEKNDNVEKQARQALKAAGLEGESYDKGFRTGFLGDKKNVVTIQKVNAEENFDNIRPSISILKKQFNAKYEGLTDNNRMTFSFKNEEEAQNFKNAVDFYFNSEENSDETKKAAKNLSVEERALETLKKVGLEGKTSSAEFYIHFEDKTAKRDTLLVGAFYRKQGKASKKVSENIKLLALKLNGQGVNFKGADIFAFENKIDAQTFQRALKIYSGENELVVENDAWRNLSAKEKKLKRLELGGVGAAVNAFYNDDIIDSEKVDRATESGELSKLMDEFEAVTKKDELTETKDKPPEKSAEIDNAKTFEDIFDEEKILNGGMEGAIEKVRNNPALRRIFDKTTPQSVSEALDKLEIPQRGKFPAGDHELADKLFDKILESAGVDISFYNGKKFDSGFVDKKSPLLAFEKEFKTDAEKAELENFTKLAQTLGGELVSTGDGFTIFNFKDENADVAKYGANWFNFVKNKILENASRRNYKKETQPQTDTQEKSAVESLDKLEENFKRYKTATENPKYGKEKVHSSIGKVRQALDSLKNPAPELLDRFKKITDEIKKFEGEKVIDVEKSAAEKLKEAGLENKTASEKYEVKFNRTDQIIFVNPAEDEILPAVKENLTRLAEKCNGAKYLENGFAFKEYDDAETFNKAAQIYLSNNEKTDTRQEKLESKKQQWLQYEKSPFTKKINENGLKAKIEVADRSGAIKVTASTKGGAEITFNLNVAELNKAADKEKFLQETVLKALRDLHYSAFDMVSPKERATTEKIGQNSTQIISAANEVYDNLKSRVSLESIGKKNISESLAKLGIELNRENLYKLAKDNAKKIFSENPNYTSGDFGATTYSSDEETVGENGETYELNNIVKLNKDFVTEAEKADLEKFIKLAESLGGEYIGDSKFAFVDEDEDILFDTKSAFINGAYDIANEALKALEIYGGKKNESSELGQSGGVTGGHRVLQSEKSAANVEERQKSDATSTEKVSGQERQTVSRAENVDTGTNAESNRPVSENDTGKSSARDSAGNGLRGSESPVHAVTEFAGHNFRISEDNAEIGSGGLKTKFKQNIDAIKLLKQLEAEGRLATPSEQKILAQFNGWGTLANAFTNNEKWQKEFQELKEILTPEEYDAAFESITNAFYTSPKIARAIWSGLEKLGFKGGRILDPSMGSGIFFGTMPAEFSKISELVGVDKDSLTGRIAKQLYQKANIEVRGFEDRAMANNYFDLAISNVPFDSEVRILADPEYKTQKYKLHDYFFAKAMDKVRPGGLVVFITSPDTMSSYDSRKLRNAINEKADLIAAYKLPNTTFEKNAGTKALADVLILQKRELSNKPSPHAQKWLDTGNIEVKDKNYRYRLSASEYFEKHPEHIIGKPVESSRYYGTLDIDGKGRDVAKELSELMQKLPENIYKPYQRAETLKPPPKKNVDSSAKNFSFVEEDGKIYQVQGKTSKYKGDLVSVPQENWATIKSYLPLMKSLTNLLNAQLLPETTDSKLADLRKTLLKNYNNFKEQHGYLNSKKNREILGSDPYYGRTAAIEIYSYDKKTKTESAKKADIFFKRTGGNEKPPTSANTASDAMYISLSYRGALDFDYMKQLTGKTENELVKELGDLIYKNPETNLQELAEEYLSGNVREKLATAKEAAKNNPEFKRNVEALKEIQPRDLTENEIATFLGSTWIDNSYYEKFAKTLNGGETVSITRGENGRFRVIGNTEHVNKMAEWKVGERKYTLYDFLEKALNRQIMLPTTKGKIDAKDAADCRARIDKLNKLFNDWIFSDETRKKELLQHFNTHFNNTVKRKYDGSHLEFSNELNPAVKGKLSPSQKDGIWRIMQGENTLLAHCVGAGKTWTMVVAGYEKKRIGKIRKPLYVVPNNIVAQFTNDIRAAYQNANILVLNSENLPLSQKKENETQQDFEKRQAKRKATLAQIATGDWDFIVASQETFQSCLPMSASFQEIFYNERIQELKNLQRAVEASEDGYSGNGSPNHSKTSTLKKIAKAIQNTKQQRDRAIEKAKQSEGFLAFDELGIDQLFIDEADCFKNLVFKTAKDNVAGISENGSARAWDLYQKTEFLNSQRKGGVVFATGTPVSNTLNEIFTLMRYLMPKWYLKEKGFGSFDEWAGLFAKFKESTELTVNGGFKSVERAILTNLQALRQVIDSFMDYKAAEDLPHLKRPKIFGGGRIQILVKATETQKKIKDQLVKRAEEIHNGGVDPTIDNMLNVTGDGRKNAIDARLIDPTISEEEAGGKIPAACENIFEVYKETADVKGTQVVFLDLGTPAKQTKKTDKQAEEIDDEDENAEVEVLTAADLSLYDRIKDGLIKRGIPAKEIAFVHDAKNAEERQRLFDKVNEGEIRVIIGSTQKMGAGTNFQKHLAALHHLDCPWRPRDIEQREGRILRTGNLNEEVKLFVYLTEDTLDGFNWEKINNKQKMITSFLKGDSSFSEIEDTSELSVSATEFVAAVSNNNPLLREHATLEQKLQNLKLQKSVYLQNQEKYQRQKQKLKQGISESENKIQNLELDIKERVKVESGDAFRMKLGDTIYEKRTEARAALEEFQKDFSDTEITKIGEIGGFDVMAYAKLFYATKNGVEKLTQKDVVFRLKNHGSYFISAEKDPIQGMANFINKGIETTLSDMKKYLEGDKTKLADIERLSKEKFEKENELQAAETKLKELDAIIAQASQEKGAARGKNAVIKSLEDLNIASENETENEIKDTENPYAEIENEIPNIKLEFKDNRRVYYINGKIAKDKAIEDTAKKIGDIRSKAVYEAVEKNLGVKPTDILKNKVKIVFQYELLPCADSGKTFETFKDAVKVARYIKKHFADVSEITVSGENINKEAFKIDDNFEEQTFTKEARKVVAELDAEAQSELNSPEAVKNYFKMLDAQNVTEKNTAGNESTYYLGKNQVSMYSATGLGFGIWNRKNNAILEEVSATTGIDLEKVERKENYPCVDFKIKHAITDNFSTRWKVENLKDAIEAAYYLSKNYSDVIEEQRGNSFIKVYDGADEVFSIDKNGKDSAISDAAAELVEELREENKIPSAETETKFNSPEAVKELFKTLNAQELKTSNDGKSYYLFGRKISADKATEYTNDIWAEKIGAMLEEVKNSTGLNLRLQKLTERPSISFAMKTAVGNWYTHWVADNLNDAIKTARYISENYSDVIAENPRESFIAVYDEKGKAFTIAKDGTEKNLGDKAKETKTETESKNQAEEKSKIILDSIEKNLGINPLDNNDVAPHQLTARFKSVRAGARAKFETFEDAVKAARYIKENFDDIDIVSVNSEGVGRSLKLNEDGSEEEFPFTTRERIANMVVAEMKKQLDAGKVTPKAAYDKTKQILGEDNQYSDETNKLIENSFSAEKENKTESENVQNTEETEKPDVKKVDTLITLKKAANGVINTYLTSDRITESRWDKSSVGSLLKSGTAILARDVTDEIKYKLAALRMYHNSPKTDEAEEIYRQLEGGEIAPKAAYDKLKEFFGEDDKYLNKINELVENSFSLEKANKKSEVPKNIANAATKAATKWADEHLNIATTPESDTEETRKFNRGLREEIIERRASEGAIAEVDRQQREALEKLEDKIKPSIEECKTFEELGDYFGEKYDIKANFYYEKELSFENVKNFAKGVEAVIREFPAVGKALNLFEVKTLADAVGADATMSFNVQEYGITLSENLAKTRADDIDTDHFKSGSHEAGHIAHYLTAHRLGLTDNFSLIEDLVDWAYDSIKTDKPLKTLQKEISDYAATSREETVAEAVKDYILNREKAAPLSKAIWKKLKSALETDEWINYELLSRPLGDDKLKKFAGLLNNKAVMAWYSAQKGNADNLKLRRFAEKMLADRELAAELEKINSASEWENLLQSKIPNEKILAEKGGLTDEKIIEMAKNRNIERAMSQLGVHVINGKIYYDDDNSRRAVRKFLENNVRPVSRYSIKNNGTEKIEAEKPDNFLAAENLTGKQKAIAEFAKIMGAPTLFFRGSKNFHGEFSNGLTYLNADSATSYDWTFWHETFHWLAANNPALYSEIVDAVEISQAQIEDYRSEIGREKLSDAETIEEILADNMKETASRVGLLQKISKKNKSLIERLISWLKSVMDKFTDFFNTPAAGLTRDQKNKMYEAFGQMARSIVDEDGNKIFRFNKSTKSIELANGENLPNVNFSTRDSKENINSKETKTTAYSGAFTADGQFKNPYLARKAFEEKIKPLRGVPFINKETGIVAQIGKKGVGKLVSDKAIQKSVVNGYTVQQHFEAAMNIKNLYENAWLAETRPDIYRQADVLSIKYFRCETEVLGEKAIAKIMAKETVESGHRIYTIELEELNKPAELKTRNGTESPAGSKGSTQTSPSTVSRSSEEPYFENISQFEDEGNTKYSINNNDNSFATFRKKLANKFFGERSGRFRKQMKNSLEELTGYKIAAGHLAEGDILVKPKPKVIRTKNEYAWENTPEFMPAVGKIVAENLNLAPSEKMNNYIASWILDGAPNNTSAEAKDFQRAMRAADDEYRDKLFDAQSKFIAWENKSAMEKMQAIISSEHDEPEFGEKFKAARAEGYAQLFEDIAPIKNLVDEIEKETGKKLLHSENPYIAFRNYKGMAGRAKMMLEGNKSTIEILQETYPRVNFKGFKTLNTILQEVGADKDDKTYDELQSYAVACHLKEIHEKNKLNLEAQKRRQTTIDNLQNQLLAAKTQSEIDELKEKLEKSKNCLEEIKKNFYITPLTEKECDEIISKYGKKYGAAQQDLVRYSNTLLAIIHDSGLMGKFKYEGLLERWKNYVPLHRLFDENENLAFGDSLKTMEGSARDIIDPIQAIIESTNSFIKRAKKNKAKILLAGLVRCNGVGNLIEEVDGKKPDDRTTITFLENGVKKYLQTDPAVVKAVNNLSPPQMNWFLRFLRLGTTITRNFMTLLNPNFAIRNWARDMQDAYLYSGKYNRNVWDIFGDIIQTPILTIQGIASALKQDADFQEWMIHGGAQASFWSMDRNYTQASIEKLTRGRLKNAPLWTRIKDRGAQALHILQAIGEYSEIGTRIGQYKKVKQHLAKLHGGKNTYDDLVTAAFESRDLMDFARGGASSRSWNVLTAFANANLQGIDKFCRTFDPAKRKTAEGRKELGYSILRLMLSSVLPAMVFFMINHDEDWYKEDLNDWERRSHWILGENFRVPKGMDFGIRFMSNLTEDFLRWSYNKDKVKFTETFAQPFLDELPDMFPTIFQPIIEAMFNYDMFTKNPIVPRRLQSLPEELQYDDRTSGIAKYLGEKTGNSPKKIEHILFGFTGNIGKGATRVADTIFGDKKIAFPPADWLPLVGGFFRVPYRNPKIINEYYEQLDEQTKWHNEYQLTGEKPEGYDENLYKRIKKVQKEMKKLGNLERAAVENLNLDSAEKDRRQIAIQKKRIALVEKVMR